MANIMDKVASAHRLILAGAAGITLTGLVIYSPEYQNYFGVESSKKEVQRQEQNYENGSVKLQEVDYTIKHKVIEKARAERRKVNYTSYQTFKNSDGTEDRYYPVEDLLKNYDSWDIIYTDKETKKVLNTSFPYRATVVRDLDSSRTPFAEMNLEKIDPSKTNLDKMNPSEVWKYTIHLREKDRIQGGVEVRRSSNGGGNKSYHPPATYHYKIQTIDLENKVEEGN